MNQVYFYLVQCIRLLTIEGSVDNQFENIVLKVVISLIRLPWETFVCVYTVQAIEFRELWAPPLGVIDLHVPLQMSEWDSIHGCGYLDRSVVHDISYVQCCMIMVVKSLLLNMFTLNSVLFGCIFTFLYIELCNNCLGLWTGHQKGYNAIPVEFPGSRTYMYLVCRKHPGNSQ